MSRKIGSLIIAVVLSGLTALAVANFQYIQDVASYHQFQPTETIASFASDTGMNENGQFLLYVSHPSLEPKEDFNKHCGKTEMTTAILGCYDGQKIYIYNIQDERLAGIRPTTAAHEMLHAAYKRLSVSDKQYVNQLLEKEYQALQQNAELADRMAFYDRTQPGERNNELHSIIGTEVRTIDPKLEEYYTRYFSDRSKVIAQREQYYSIFTELRERADSLSLRIDELASIIKNDQANYSAAAASLQASISSFNDRASSGDFENRDAFDQERGLLIARTAELEQMRNRINATVTEYNRLVAELDEIAIETKELNSVIDSNLTPAPSI